MKEIKAVIAPHMLQHVLDALHSLPHFPGVTVSDCRGHGRGRGAGGQFQPQEDSLGLAPKVKLEVFCRNDQLEEIVNAIVRSAHTGRRGDGILMVADLPWVVRIRTGEDQNEAL